MKNGKKQTMPIKHRRNTELDHQERMQIYNEVNSTLFSKAEVARKHNISNYTLKVVYEDIYSLIRYKVYGEPPKHPKKCNICGGRVRFNRCDIHKSRSGFVYYCTKCYAWVATSPRNKKDALGELADTYTRKRRRDLHQWFDKLWENSEEREYYYNKLAVALGKSECHFAQMTLKELDQAESIVKKWWLEKYDR